MTARLTLAYRSMSVYILSAFPDPILDRRIGLGLKPRHSAAWYPIIPPFTIAPDYLRKVVLMFRWKDYQTKGRGKGKARHQTMKLEPQKFILRRFLLHVLPSDLLPSPLRADRKQRPPGEPGTRP